jgi:hypothetical protein
MKRTLALVVVAAAMGALVLSSRTEASGIIPGGIPAPGVGATPVCVSLPKQTPCPTASIPTITELSPVKSMSISAPISEPYGVDAYTIDIVSKIGCFNLTEPVIVTALGNHGEAVLRQTNPPIIGGNPYVVNVVPSDTGTATLSLEVLTSQVGPSGLTVKAVWPAEGVEQLQTIVAGTPQPTPTGVATSVPTATPAATGTPAPTSTPAPTVTSTPTPLTLDTCYSPLTSAIDIRSVPGAICTLTLTLNHGLAANTTYQEGPFAIPASGVGEVPFVPATGSTQGTAVTACSYGGQSETNTLTFTIPIPTPTPTPIATP